MKVKRFLVFSAQDYNERGGWWDLDAMFDTEAEGKEWVASKIDEREGECRAFHRFQLVNLETGALQMTSGTKASAVDDAPGTWGEPDEAHFHEGHPYKP